MTAFKVRFIRDDLEACWRKEGVNHYENCHELAKEYLTQYRANPVSFVVSLMMVGCRRLC